MRRARGEPLPSRHGEAEHRSVADSSRNRPLFFIHVMKSAGTTVTGAFRSALDAAAIYPNPDDDGDLLEAW